MKTSSEYNEGLEEQIKTLAEAVLALQEKIESSIEEYKGMPLAQEVTTTQGERAFKQNPAVQEFRNTVREYTNALKSLQELTGETIVTDSGTSAEDIRSRFKIAL